ncbi:MAG: hypothetical protein MK078_12310 [Crocinitomicaceae bacterium]|nr:hypothetical protein [Crocinitomicaceae bacterium]
MGKVFENKYVRYEVIEGILWATYKEGPITLEAAKVLVEERLRLSEGNSYPLLIRDFGLKSIKGDARDFFVINRLRNSRIEVFCFSYG